jgi:hypothetical protein
LKILKTIWAFLNWLLIPHGYDVSGGYSAGAKKFPIAVVEYKCKQCGQFYKSIKRNDTCSKISCFIGYRVR